MAMAFVEGLGWVEKQTKAVDITENGSLEITPDRGMLLDSVTVNTAVPQNDVDLDEYVKKTDYATTAQGGVIKVDDRYGSRVLNGILDIIPAVNTEIDTRQVNDKPITLVNNNNRHTITPATIDYAVKKVLIDKKIELTDEEKSAALAWFGLGDIVARIEALEELGLEVTINMSDELGNPIELKLVRGMTWSEWIGSSYNTGGFHHDGINVFYGGSFVTDFSTGYNASPHDIIKTSAGNYYCSSV